MPEDRQDTIKQRLANAAAREATESGQPAPAQPAQAPDGAPEPAPDAPAPTPAPVAPPPPAAPSIDPGEHQRLQEQLDQTRQQLAAFAEQSKADSAELAARRAQEAQKMQLPSESELDEMGAGKAALMVAEATKAYADARERALADDLNRNVIQPNQEKMGRIARVTAEQEVERAYPGMMGKYGPAMHDYMATNPRTSAIQALKAVADPRDLSTALSAQPTTPQAVSQEAAAHVDTGRPGNVQGTPAQRTDSQPTARDKMVQAAELRKSGDYEGAKAARRDVLKERLGPRHPALRGGAGG